MSDSATRSASVPDQQQMHEVYRRGGGEKRIAPHVVYAESGCPHEDCDQRMQAIDFRLEEYGRAVHDPLVVAWWSDTGFVGRCPKCGGWIHFTIRAKRAVSSEQLPGLPRLPDDWFSKATVL